jgi:diguanylate cyclase (GGDEF)-like protein
MSIKKGLNKLIKNKMLYHEFLYALAIVVTCISKVTGNGTSTGYMSLCCVIMGAMIVTEFFIKKFFEDDLFLAIIIRVLGYILVMLLEYKAEDKTLYLIWILISVVLGTEYIAMDSMYDKATVPGRKLLLSIITFTFIVLSYTYSIEGTWLIYMVVRIASIGVIFYMADYLLITYENCNTQLNELYARISGYEQDNNKLLEYQERVKETNEQINYQKIDLTRAYKELEQINIETKAQAEIMKYLSSTFDIYKCINVVIDAITEVKKPKLCAIYLNKSVFNSQEGSCNIKTNYASMQRRLKRDIEGIYEEVVERDADNEVVHGDSVKKYRFIGDTNIEAIAVLPIKDSTKIHGIMIIASDEDDFFDKGLDFYDNCMTDFVISVKSTKLYLKTQDMARKDGLTKIYNRVYFMELFENAAKTAARDNKPLSVALFDIDKFKSVNDTYGHLAGDKVIKMVAQTGQKYADKYDGFTCRYGGEEFLLVFPDKDEQETLEILEEFHNEIKSTKVQYDKFSIDVNVCIGLSSYPNICKAPELLVNRADISMYYGKKHGRGRLVLDNPLVDEVDEM